MTKSNLRRKRFIPSHSSQSIMRGSQDRSSRQEVGGRNWNRGHGRVLLTGLLSTSCPACCFIDPGWLCPQWEGPSHINQESRKCSTDSPTDKSDRGIFSVKVPFSQMASRDDHQSTGMTTNQSTRDDRQYLSPPARFPTDR